MKNSLLVNSLQEWLPRLVIGNIGYMLFNLA